MVAKCRLGCVAGEGGKKCQMGCKGIRCWELHVSSPGSGWLWGQTHVTVSRGGPTTKLRYTSVHQLWCCSQQPLSVHCL